MSEIYYRHGLVRRVLSGQCVVVAAAPSPIFAPSEISAADAIAGAGVVRQTHLQVDRRSRGPGFSAGGFGPWQAGR